MANYSVSQARPQRQFVIIEQVNPDTMMAYGRTPNGNKLYVDLSLPVGMTVVIPQIGEEWVAVPMGDSRWVLSGRSDYQNPALAREDKQLGDHIYYNPNGRILFQDKNGSATFDPAEMQEAIDTAEEAKVVADEAKTAADTAQNTANAKNSVWYQASMPGGTGHKVNDIWYDTDGGNRMYWWTGNAWMVATYGAAAITDGSIDFDKLAPDSVDFTKMTAEVAQTIQDANDAVAQVVDDTAAAVAAAADAGALAVQAKASGDAALIAANAAAEDAEDAISSAESAVTAGNAAAAAADAALVTAGDADTKAVQALATATDAASDAEAANTAALNAAGIANSKGRVYYGTSAPAGDVNGLWIDQTGNANTPKRWSGSAWVAVTDKAATDAASAAAAANTLAGEAKDTADDAIAAAASADSKAIAAQTAAATAQGVADTAVSDAADAHTAADNAASDASDANDAALAAAGIANGKGKVYYGTTAPAGDTNGLWIDQTSGNNTPKRWSGSAWVAVTDKVATAAASAASAAQTTANNAATAASTADGKAVTALTNAATAASAAATADGKAVSAQTAANAAQTTANAANTLAGQAKTIGENAATVGAAAQTKADQVGTDLDAVEAILPSKADTSYVQSRGTDLVANGTGFLGNNYNFSQFTYVASDSPTGTNGSFLANGTTGTRSLDESVPVDPGRRYVHSVWVRETVPSVSNGRFYVGLAPKDASGQSIIPQNFVYIAGTTTTLSAPLNPGDTEVHLASVSGWNNGGTGAFKRITFWNWVDSLGKIWPAETYSRNHAPYDSISGNTLTLSAPYTGPALTSGHPVSNGNAGGTYMYTAASNETAQQTWTHYASPEIGGTWTPGDNANFKFPPGTTSVSVVFLTNRTDTNSRQAFAGVSLSDASAAYTRAETAALAAAAADTKAATALTSANGKNATTYASTDPVGNGTRAGDLWYKQSGSEVVGLWYWNGATWSPKTLRNEVIATLDAAKITTGTLNAARIGANAITAGKIDADAITARELAADSVTASEIKALAIASGHIAADAIVAGKIAANAVAAREIAADTITAAQIAANAITASEIAADAVTAAKIKAGEVVAGKLAANAVVAGNIAANAVTAGTVAANAITAGTIAANAVTSAKIISNAIQAAHVSAGAIETAALAAGAVTAAKITAGTITGDKLVAATVTAREVATSAITTDKLAAFSITAGKLAAGSIETAAIASGAITSAQIAAGTITAGNIAGLTITGDKIAANTITAAKLEAAEVRAALLTGDAFVGKTFTGGTFVGSQIKTGTTSAHIEMNGAMEAPFEGFSHSILGSDESFVRWQLTNDMMAMWDSEGTNSILLNNDSNIGYGYSLWSNYGAIIGESSSEAEATIEGRMVTVRNHAAIGSTTTRFARLVMDTENNRGIVESYNAPMLVRAGTNPTDPNMILTQSDTAWHLWQAYPYIHSMRTTTYPGNMHWSSTDQQVYWGSTSMAYAKMDQENIALNDALAILDVPSRTWRDKAEVDDDPDTTKRLPGFIANDVLAVSEANDGALDPLIDWNSYGGVASMALNYDRVGAYHNVIIAHLLERLELAEAAIAELTQPS